MTSYNEIINSGSPEGGANSLKTRLIKFRKWSTKEANITVHGAVCIVNGEATDGTRNAPVLVFDTNHPDPRGGLGDGGKDDKLLGGHGGGHGLGGMSMGMGGSLFNHHGGSTNNNNGSSSEVRCGAIDNVSDRAMYDRNIGCQVRTSRDLKKDEIALSIPISAMVTPDLIAVSDAGRAILACCQTNTNNSSSNQKEEGKKYNNFWNAFGITSKLEKMQAQKIQQNSGTQLLVKILQERKKVETVLMKAEQREGENNYTQDSGTKLASWGMISYRAPYLAFLIHQRFANEDRPLVVSSSFEEDDDILLLDEETPETFAPYARTLPSSVCLPICWKRNELALLAGCIPGMPALQKVAARTMQLSSELIALVNAGLLYRFPNVFTKGMITWDRWVWAAAVYESRALSYSTLPPWIWSKSTTTTNSTSSSSSPQHVWENCGVIIPFLDMLNHEDDTAQAQWSSKFQQEEDEDDDTSSAATKRLNVITNEKTRKHMQVYRNYGMLDNEHFMLQFGFTRMGNPADKVRIAWALVDGVGGVDPPADYEPVSDDGGIPASHLVFESLDADSVKSWWTEQRIALLGKATLNNDETLESLRKGKKITFCAFNNGKIDQYLIAVAVVATLSPDKVAQVYKKTVAGSSSSSSSSKPLDGLTLDKTCQHSVRMYLSFLFAKKLGKLLQSLNSCLKDHFNSVQLWTKATKGGLNYVASNDDNAMSIDGGGEKTSTIMGWQTFFDTYVWYSTMEVEDGKYYAMAPDSCVLTLYDGHVRSLQSSLDVMATDETFHDIVKQQLCDLGCTLDNTPIIPSIPSSITVKSEAAVVTQSPAMSAAVSEKDTEDEPRVKVESSRDEKKAAPQDPAPPKKDERQNGEGGGNGSNKRDRDRDRNKGKSKGDRPPAIKLHIGNLSYKTLPNQLYDFFTKLYGKDSVLECHIPTERDTGNSRGFGFVTMPEHHAKAALESSQKHEMDGRILKVAQSNSAGSGRGGKGGEGGRNPQSDRCPNCGYRPRWCTCNPNMMPMGMGMGGGPPPPPDNIYGPGPYMSGPPMGGPAYGHPHEMDDRRMGGGDGYGWGGSQPSGGWGSRRSYSRSPSYRRDRDRGYRGRSRSYSRSRSRSYSRGRHRRYDDDRRRGSSRRKGRDADMSPRRYRSKSRSRSVPVEPGGKSLSRSRSPNLDRPKKSRRKRSKGSRRGKEKRRGGSRSRSR